MANTLGTTKIVTDQLGREVKIAFPPKRIISIVPSQTELLFYLGLDEEIAGITKFCIHPEEKVKSKLKIGGTKNLNIEKIKQINPGLIIGNKEENNEQQVTELMKVYPVWMSDVKTLNDAYDMMDRVGVMVNKKAEAEKLTKTIQLHFERLSELSLFKNKRPLKTLYLIWRNPYMTIGGDTFINTMLELSGLENCLKNKRRYPELTQDEIKELNPGVVLLSSEPYPFKEKHVDELKLLCPSAKIRLVDGELFSWYGNRLLQSPAYFQQLLQELN